MAMVQVVYHSGFGHTQRVAEAIVAGANAIANVTAAAMPVDALDWDALAAADAIIFGSPVYMGSVSAAFKAFMDSTSKVWFTQSWQDKLAAGFVNSGALCGDKQVALQQLQAFACQHGMIWLSFSCMPEGTEPHHLNRLGSYAGLMTQSDNLPPEQSPPEGDMRTAIAFGRYMAERTLRWARSRQVT